jgi:hypothetical protein
VRKHMHQRQGEVPSTTGVRMLRRPTRAMAALSALVTLMSPVTLRADVEDCRDAIQSFKSARSDIASALQSYVSCVSGSDGHDDCSSEFGTLNSAQDDFESAVSSYEGECS